MNSFHISTWNVEGKGSPQEIDNILSRSYKVKSEENISHIICVQQANLPSSKETLNYTWLCSGEFGSAVLVNKASSLKSNSYEQICEQICVAEIVTGVGTVVKIISCYIPPSADYVTRDLWPKLAEIIKTIPCWKQPYVLAGDFNAEIGSEDTFRTWIDRGTVGPMLYHKASNENGIQLRKLVFNSHTILATTFGTAVSGLPGYYTYKNGEEKSQRSFIVVPSDRIPYPLRIMMQDNKFFRHPDYKSAVISKTIKFTLHERFSTLIESKVIVSSWNIQGASPSVVDRILAENGLPVMCVQELFLTSDLDVETENYSWFTSKKLWGKNVGILVKKSSDISMAKFEVTSECLCVGDITLNGCTIKVICCYIPLHTESGRFQEVTEKLTNLVKGLPKETLYLVAGDFNTHITYSMLDDPLVFNEGDDNGLFLQRFMKECDVELQYMTRNSETQASEKIKRNTSHILMSAGCMLKFCGRRFNRWVPFFEHGIVTLFLPDHDIEEQLPNSESKKQTNQKDKEVEKVEHIDGFMYVTKKFGRLKRFHSARTSEYQVFRFINPGLAARTKSDDKTDLPENIVAQYKNTPPPIEELVRILGDGFTLYFGFLQESTLPSGCLNVLPASFESLKRGTLVAECIDVFEEETKTPVKRIVKFRWNGIVVHQQEGGRFISYKMILNKGQKVFVSNLGQHYFTVKAKASFYNNGLPPLCQDENKLNEVLRVMKREDFSPSATVEEVNKFISKFFLGDPYFELVFGPDFSLKLFLEPIKAFATTKGLGVRWFKSTKDLRQYDNLSIFIDRSPQEIRKRLVGISDHQDLKFQLLPPCGTDKDYFDWCAEWTEKTIPEEYYKPYEEKANATITETNTMAQEGNKPGDIEQVNVTEKERTKRNVGFKQKIIKKIGGDITKIVSCANLGTTHPTPMLPKGNRNWIEKAREESDLPQGIVDKYCETPIPVKELVRILGEEFILYYGFMSRSTVVSNEILSESFEAINRGGIMVENIEHIKSRRPLRQIVKFKWNGICIHEERGTVNQSFKAIRRTGQKALTDKLGRHFYAIKAKISFYNNGLPPLCKDKEKLDEVLRVVKMTDFSSTCNIDEVKTFISNFFLEDTNKELVFGTDFLYDTFLDPIRNYAREKDLGFRWFKSSEKATQFDSISVFKKRSPVELCDALRDLPDNHDLRFFLVPPCEFSNKCHYDWIKHWAEEVLVEEFKLMKEKEEKMAQNLKRQNLQNKEKMAQNLKRQNLQNKKTTRGNRAGIKRSLQQANLNKVNYNNRSQRLKLTQTAEQIRRLQERYEYRERQQLDQYREYSRSQPSRLEQQYQDFIWEQARDYGGNSRQDRSEDYHRSSISLKVFGDLARYPEPEGRKRGWEEIDYYRESSNSQPYRSDDYGRSSDPSNRYENEDYSVWLGNQSHNTQPERYTPENKRARQQPMPNTYAERGKRRKRARQQPTPNTYAERYTPESKRARQQPMHNTSAERYMPENKRARVQPLPKADKPRWDDIGPLVIVWPISVRSENERDARKVLEANFPTEISLESNNRVAVYVTLPLRKTRGEKTYCLCVGSSVNSATRIALDLIVKHGSVIKYNANYLPPDGLVPNFIRYNVPCQTNPRTYVTLGWMDTGPLTEGKINELFESFKNSFNEDLFFNKDNYTHEEKLMLLDMAPRYGLKVRHFGVDSKLVNRYVCVYKTKPKDEVLEEVLRMRDFHPKYKLVTNKLPPRLGLNIF